MPVAWTQKSIWFRNDNGSESTATFMGAQDSSQTLICGSAGILKFRLRIQTGETGTTTGKEHPF